MKIIKSYQVLFYLLSFFFILGCNSEEAPVKRREPVAVDVIVAKFEDVAEEIKVGGVVEANEEVVVSAEISAVIKRQLFREGDRVKKGDVLAEFDDETFKLAFQSKKAELNKAKALLLKSEEEIERRRELFEKGFVAKEELDEVESQLKVALADVELARTSLELAKRDMVKTKVISPIGGTVTERMRKTGENVRQGDLLFHIAQYAVVRIVVSLSERDVLSVKSGETVEVSVGPFNDIIFKGKVKRVGVPSQPSEGVFPVEVVVNNPNLRIKPGMVAKIVFKGAVHRDVIVVPRDIISERLGESVVFVVNNDKASARKVKPGTFFGFNVSLKEGINPGDKIVVVGYDLLFDNAPVKIRSIVNRGDKS